MGKLLNSLGNVSIAADASMRVIKVMNIEDAGDDWMREGANQITGFGLGGAFGTGTGRAVFAGGIWAATQAGLTLAGPVGWATLGLIFIASLSVGCIVGTKTDIATQAGSELIMDSL